MDDSNEEFISEDDFKEVIDLDENKVEFDEDDDDQEIDEDDGIVQDDSILTFAEHQQPVLCCDVSCDDQLVVTGGQDDRAIVWNPKNQEIKFEITEHKDSVVAVKFNKNSSMIATGDLSGLIFVWNLEGKKLYDYEVDDLCWLLWHPLHETVLLAGTESGTAWMWKLSKSNPQCKTFQSFGFASITAKIFNNGARIVMGYENGAVRLWDLKEAKVINTLSEHNSHKSSVNCIDINVDEQLVATGSTDSTVKIINASSFKVLMTLDCGINSSENDERDSIESVVFGGNNLLAIGSVKGQIEIWNVSSQTKRNELKLESGVCKIQIDNKKNATLLYAGGLDSFFRIIDLRTCEIIAVRSGHKDQILDFCVSSDCKNFLTCSEDSTCKIFSFS